MVHCHKNGSLDDNGSTQKSILVDFGHLSLTALSCELGNPKLEDPRNLAQTFADGNGRVQEPPPPEDESRLEELSHGMIRCCCSAGISTNLLPIILLQFMNWSRI